MKHILIAGIIASIAAGSAFAAPKNQGQPADTIHPNIHDKVGRGDGTNANPNGNGNGGQIHGIANNPGKSNTNPNDDGTNGFANQLNNVHGGIGAYNKNAGN